jgi:hypothetical protein
MQGRLSDAAKAFKVAMPILKPVKLPGPEAQAKRSTSASFTPASARLSLMSFNKVADWETFGSPIRVASSTVPNPSQTLPAIVAVSKLNMTGAVIEPGPEDQCSGSPFDDSNKSRPIRERQFAI